MGFTDFIYTCLGEAVDDTRPDFNPSMQDLRNLVTRTAFLIAEKDGKRKNPNYYWDAALRTLVIPIKRAVIDYERDRHEHNSNAGFLFEEDGIPKYDSSKQEKDLSLILEGYEGIFGIVKNDRVLDINKHWFRSRIPLNLKYGIRNLLVSTLCEIIEES